MTGEEVIPNSELPIPHSMRRIVSIAMSTRAVHDVAMRMVYPFLPDFAAGLGISIEQMGGLIALALTAGSVGRLIADLTGSALVTGAGFSAAAGVSMMVALVTVVVFVRWVKESGIERQRD